MQVVLFKEASCTVYIVYNWLIALEMYAQLIDHAYNMSFTLGLNN